MKTLLTVTILVGGSLAFAQVTATKQTNFGNNPNFPQMSFLKERKVPAKKELFELAVPNLDEDQSNNFENRQKPKINLKAARGTEGVGGGNGVQTSDGKITPLDVIFIDANSKVDVREKYPVALKFFETQVAKISNAIPSFAKDIKLIFSKLNWNLTGLDLNEQGCLNSMGLFKVRAGDKQVTIACQNKHGVVTMSQNAVKLLKKPEYLGVVFLHEVFMFKLLEQHSGESYKAIEEMIVTNIMPYILSGSSLDPKELYSYAAEVGFVTNTNPHNRYALEVFEGRRDSYQTEEAARVAAEVAQEAVRMKVGALRARKTVIEEAVKIFESSAAIVDSCPRIDGSFQTYLVQYGDLLLSAEELNDAYKEALQMSSQYSSTSWAADASTQHLDLSILINGLQVADLTRRYHCGK
jgi:hypothetical protein